MEIKPYVRLAHYHETDQMGIIHHANYIRWMEEARVDFMAQTGLGYREMEELGISSPVTELRCTYRSMVRFGDEVSIALSILRYTGVRMELAYEIRDRATGELRAEAASKHCFLSREGRPVSLKRAAPEYDAVYRALADQGTEAQ